MPEVEARCDFGHGVLRQAGIAQRAMCIRRSSVYCCGIIARCSWQRGNRVRPAPESQRGSRIGDGERAGISPGRRWNRLQSFSKRVWVTPAAERHPFRRCELNIASSAGSRQLRLCRRCWRQSPGGPDRREDNPWPRSIPHMQDEPFQARSGHTALRRTASKLPRGDRLAAGQRLAQPDRS